MKILVLYIVVSLFLVGCQSAPRYGGVAHTAEGDYRTRSRNTTTDSTIQVTAQNYAVDPIALGHIIDQYLGKPYSGQIAGVKGFDCSEFVGRVYSEYASIHLPRTTKDLFRAGRAVQPGDLYFGDLVFFDTGGRGVSHVGIYVGFDEFVHSSSSQGIIISNINDKYYSKRYLGARRVME